MLFHLFLQLLSGSGDRPQAGKIASVYMETEQIQVLETGLSHEKEIPGVADGRQDLHVLMVFLLRYLLERKAQGPQMDAEHFIDGFS